MGDCNNDELVNAADLVAILLEIGDGDGVDWLNAPGGTFPGNPAGCDADRNTLIDNDDVACTVNLLLDPQRSGCPLR